MSKRANLRNSALCGLAAGVIVLATLAAPKNLSAAEIAGAWMVTWDNGAPNPMTLVDNRGTLKGTYRNDAQQSCEVSGDFDAGSGGFAVHVKCPNYRVELEGTLANDGSGAEGKYWFRGESTGSFEMSRATPTAASLLRDDKD